MNLENKKVLFVHYYFPPIHSIGAKRNFQIYNQWRKSGAKCWVLTTTNKNTFPHDHSFQTSNYETFPIKTFDYRTILALKGKKGHLTENQKSGIIPRLFIKLNLSFPFNLIWGEGGIIYIINGYFKGSKLIKQNGISIICSSFMPYSDHFIAFLLKLRYPNLRWVADFRDLHLDPIYKYYIWEGFQVWCNRMILKKADFLTTVSKGLAENLKQFHPEPYVFSNGIEQTKINLSSPQQHEKFTISYTGSLFTNERDPKPFLASVKELLERKEIDRATIKIVYVGKDGLEWEQLMKQFELNDLLEYKGLVSNREAIQLQQQSDVNLLLSSSSKQLQGVFTGKFFEYLAARKPILLIINGSKDLLFEQHFSQYNAGLVAYNTEASQESIKSFLLNHYHAFLKNGFVEPSIPIEKLERLSWESLFLQFVNKMKIMEREEK